MNKTYLPYLLILILQIIALFLIPKVDENTIKETAILTMIALIECFSFWFGTQKIEKALKSSQAKFNAVFFGVTGLRMILIIFLLAMYLIFIDLVNKSAIILLICSYFLYVGFEIKIIYTKLRPDFKSQNNNENARK